MYLAHRVRQALKLLVFVIAQISNREEIAFNSIWMATKLMVCTVFKNTKDLVSTLSTLTVTRPLKVEDGLSSRGDRMDQLISTETGLNTKKDLATLKASFGSGTKMSTISQNHLSHQRNHNF